MKAVVIKEFVSNLDDVKTSDIPEPTPDLKGYLIRVHAAGANFVDTLYAQGKHQNNKSLVRPPFTLGLEFAGTVISAPADSDFVKGDRVFGGHTGSYAEIISLPATTTLRRIPPSWDFAGAAGICATLPVSYAALMSRAGIKSGQTVLVHAAAGGLGIMAVQVAKAYGCRVIGTAGSDEKCKVATKYGADHCINYNAHPDWWKEVLTLTGDKGVDVVYDPVGLVDLSIKCIAHFGKLLVVGFAGGAIEKIAMNRVLLKQVSLIGYRFGESLRRDPAEEAQLWEGLQPLIDDGKIVPVVYDHEYRGLESVSQALKDLAGRRTWGKAIIRLEQPTAVSVGARL
ncbi:quinone oxidoreductase [Plectosphaerella cucumerina]|uniref:Quinone oxidoreductase n=1 Tax=Plectosphaerella cucumerina TaxID=40658 RepID=A0A8K0TEP0_9PEZI|nr:quinone oxidoreductase [Plectosphaerella cucumerina]